MPSREHIATLTLATLLPEEHARCAVYVAPAPIEKGATVRIGRQPFTTPVASVLAFVDLSPGTNWGHPCRYLLIDPETNAIRQLEAQFPPPVDELRLLYRGSDIEDWMLLTKNQGG